MTSSPPSVVRSARFSGTSVQKSGLVARAIASISSVAAISRLSTPETVSRSTRTSRSWMWRRSSRRCTVMPSAPASSHSDGGDDGVRVARAALLAQRRDVVDVDVEPDHGDAASSVFIACAISSACARMRPRSVPSIMTRAFDSVPE